MKSKITKYAAAAMIIITITLVINQFDAKLNITNTALAEAIANMDTKPWLHQIGKYTSNDQEEYTSELWISFENKIFATKHPSGHGTTDYHDYNTRKLCEYDSSSHTIQISYSEHAGDSVFQGVDSIGSYLSVAIDEFKQKGAEIKERTGTYNGKKVLIYDMGYTIVQESSIGHRTTSNIQNPDEPLPEMYSISLNNTLFVDTENNLIIAKKFTEITENMNTNEISIREGETILEYPETGPTSIYDLGVPRNAKIVGTVLPTGFQHKAKFLNGNLSPANESEKIIKETIAKNLKKNSSELTEDDCEKVLSLNLRGNTISDISSIAELTNLRYLALVSTDVNDFKPLANLTLLESLDLTGSKISDVSMLANLKNLKILRLKRTKVSDIKPLASLKQLEQIDLDNTQVSDINVLANMENLISIGLDNTPVSDISMLANLTHLSDIQLSNTKVSDEQIQELYNVLPPYVLIIR